MVFLEKETSEVDWGVGEKAIYFLSSSQVGPLRVSDICGDIFCLLLQQHVVPTTTNGTATYGFLWRWSWSPKGCGDPRP